MLYKVPAGNSGVFMDNRGVVTSLHASLERDLLDYRLLFNKRNRRTVKVNAMGFMDGPIGLYKPLERPNPPMAIQLPSLDAAALQELVGVVGGLEQLLDDAYLDEDDPVCANIIYRLDTVLPLVSNYVKWENNT